MFKASILLLLANLVHGVANYGFHFTMGRLLTLEEYGNLGALSSLLMIISVPCFTILSVVTKFTSTFKADNNPQKMKYLYYELLRKTTYFSIFFFLFLSIFSGLVKTYLNLNSVSIVFALIIGVIASFYQQAVMGVWQGMQYFRLFAMQSVLYGVFKFFTGVALVYSGFKLFGAIAGISSAPLLISLVFGYLLFKHFRNTREEVCPIGIDMIKYSSPVLFGNLFMLLLFSTDMMFIPMFFNEKDNGLYVAALTLSRVIYYYPGLIVYVLFPMVAENHAKELATRALILKAMFIALVTALVGATLLYFGADFWMESLYGEKFVSASPLLRFSCFSLIPLALLNLYLNYELAKERYSLVWKMAIAYVLQLVLFFMFHSSYYSILFIMGLIPSVLFAILLIGRLLRKRKVAATA